MTVSDVSALRRSLEEVQHSRDYAYAIVDTVRQPLVVLDGALRVGTANRAFYQFFHTSPAETEGRLLAELGNGQWNVQPLLALLREALRHDSQIQDFEIAHDVPHAGRRSMLLNACRFIEEWKLEPLLLLAVEDITERKRAEEAEQRLRESERAYRTLVEESLQGLVVVQHGQVVFANRATADITGSSAAELMSLSAADLVARVVAEDREAMMLCMTDRAAGGATAPTVEFRIVRPDGAQRWVECHASLLEYHGEPAMQVVYRDISERKSAEAEIRQLNADLERRVRVRTAELEAAVRDLESFSYSISHDLRSPLRAIDGYSAALLDEHAAGLDAQGLTYLRRVRAGAQQMGRLIDDLLELSRVMRHDLDPQPLDLSTLARSIVTELQARHRERTVEVVIAARADAVGDPALLRVALANLLDNAWKFTGRQAAPRIEFGVTDADGARAYFVRDNGAGFQMAFADTLFQAFHRLHLSSEFEGAGIGLATARQIIERHGGRIWAKAAIDQGATFFFTLPTRNGV